MFRHIINGFRRSVTSHHPEYGAPRFARRFASSSSSDSQADKEDKLLSQDLRIPGVYLDEVDKIISDEVLQPFDDYFPNTQLAEGPTVKPLQGHNLVVIQPWVSYSNFGEFTDPDIQLNECVSLGNTIHNWQVVDKRLLFVKQLNRKHIVGPKAFEELKESIQSTPGVSAVFFGVELLSAIQLSNLEKGLEMAVYDRFTVVLNIFRQHARTTEARLQVALAELPYIRSHLREIHESSEYSSTAESLKMVIGGLGERTYHKRLNILKKRESRLKYLLQEIKKQRDITKRMRRKIAIPTVSVVGYTNCGKTSLIKYLTDDQKLEPKDQLFATLDVTVHQGTLPSTKTVLYADTVGFISRIPLLLVDAFSATLQDIQESDLILHLLDITHPDHRLQYTTVTKALESLKIPRSLLQSKLTIGNKVDLLSPERAKEGLPKCDIQISVTGNKNMSQLVEMLDNQLMSNLRHEHLTLRVENGGKQYAWLRKNGTIVSCEADEADGNYLVCRVIMSPASAGRLRKLYGTSGFVD